MEKVPNVSSTPTSTNQWDSLSGPKAEQDNGSQEQTDSHNQEMTEFKNYTDWLKHNQARTANEVNNDFGGEENTNRKTGNQRTFTEWDLYPKTGTNQEFGEQIRKRNDTTVFTELFPKDQDETAEQYSQRIANIRSMFPRQEGEKFQAYKERVEAAHNDGTMLEEIVERTIDKDSEIGKELIDDLANIADMQKSGRFDAERAKNFRKEVAEKALYKQREQEAAEARQEHREALRIKKEQEARARAEQEERERAEQEARARAEQEERERAEQEARARAEQEERERLKIEKEQRERESREKQEQEEEQIKQRLKEIDEELGSLVAINADFTHDRKELAHDIAERQLNEEKAKVGLIKRIWKGSLFGKYYQKKYERELLSGERKAKLEGAEHEETLDEIIARRSGDAIQRFVLGATEDMRYIHEKIGKKRKDDTYDGEKMTEADSETTNLVRSAVEEFAQAKIPEDGSMEDLKREFSNKVKHLKAEAKDQGQSIDSSLIDNYFEVALQARQRVEHGIAMDRVMEGFKVYNADVRNNMRTKAHRDAVDKAVNWLENKGIGLIVPIEAVALAVGSVWSLAQTGARTAAKVAVPVGGIAVSGALAGLRERNRVTEDRTRMMRDAAVGLEYDGTAGGEVKGHRAKKRAKYEAKIGGTIYDLKPAKELTENITQATEGGNNEDLLNAIAEARVRISFSDFEQKDLISYSSADKMGDERTKLDMAVIRAENNLSDADRQKLETIKAALLKDINSDVEKNDKDFRKIRAAQAVKQAGKTIAIGSAVFFASQEITATLDPNKIGLFEKAGLIKTSNNENAQETLLAGLAGPRVRTEVHTDTVRDISGDRQAEIQQYENAGYTKVETSPAWTETKKGLVDVDPSKSTAQVRVAYDGWANNGTSVSDGNELRMYLNNGQISSGMFSTSTMGGQVIDYNTAASAGNIKGFLTIGDAKFEIASKVNSAGQLTWGNNGVFTTTTGETIKAIGPNGEKLYKYFEIALDNGKDVDGVSHIVPLATDVGADSFSGKIQQIADTVVEHPAMYDFVKNTVTETPREVNFGGIFGAPSSRVGLGGARPASTESNSGPNETPTSPNPTPNQPTEPAPNGSPAPNPPQVAPNQAPESSSESTPEPASTQVSNQTSGATSAPNRAPNLSDAEKTEFTRRVRENFGDLLGEEWVKLISSGEKMPSNINELWDTLGQSAKTAIIELEETPQSQPYGKFLKAWLQEQGYISNDNN